MASNLLLHPCPVALSLTCVVLSACGHRGNARQTVPVPYVVMTNVTAGDIVEPTTVILLELSSAASAFAPGDVVVSDGGNPLPGTLARIGTSTTWSWTPARELPRGCPIAVATAQQGVVATCAVRDIALDAELELPGERASAAYAWPDGRRAVRTESGRILEVAAGGFVERFVVMSPNAHAYGDGDFIDEQTEAGVQYCVRGNLDGRVDRVPTPDGVAIGGHNTRGDVVVFVPNTLPSPSSPGLWRMLRTDTSFTLAGALTLPPQRTAPVIEADGTVSLVHAEAGGVRLSRFAIGDPVGEHHALALQGDIRSAAYDADAEGRGVFACVTRHGLPAEDVAQIARFDPGVGLRLLTASARRWPVVSGGVRYSFAYASPLRVGAWGSACLVLESGIVEKGRGVVYEVMRIEPGDLIAGPSFFISYSTFGGRGYGNPSRTRQSPFRAEQWTFLSSPETAPSELALYRSRPDGNVAFRTLHRRLPPRRPDDPWSFAFDDSGRAVVALTETAGGVSSTRILVWN